MSHEGAVEAAFAAAAKAGSDRAALRGWLEEWGHDEQLLVAVLKRAVGASLLECVGSTRPFCDRARVAAALARQPRTPVHVSQRLLPALHWRDLAEVAAGPYLPGLVRVRAEALLAERLPDMRLGDRIALARMATRPLLRHLLQGGEPQVIEAALQNPRLGEDALAALLREPSVGRALIDGVASSSRWRSNYAARRALVLQPRTPLPVALAHLTSLVRADLRRAAADTNLAPLLRAAAERVLDQPGRSR